MKANLMQLWGKGNKDTWLVGHLSCYVAFLFENATLSHLRNRTVWLLYVNIIMRHHQHNTPSLKDNKKRSLILGPKLVLSHICGRAIDNSYRKLPLTYLAIDCKKLLGWTKTCEEYHKRYFMFIAFFIWSLSVQSHHFAMVGFCWLTTITITMYNHI